MRVIHRVQDNIKLLELSVSDDRQKLFARVVPQIDCHSAAVEDIRRDIETIAPAELLEEEVIYDICLELRQNKGCESRRVAKGKEPEIGRDGKLVWLVRRFRPGANGAEDREFADFFTLGLFENIEAGREIARIYRPGAGAEGIDVQGKKIPAKPGKPFNARCDNTVELRSDPAHENYTSVIAANAGYVHDEGEKFSVRDTLHISGNLDWNMGHIDFVGNVKVMGDVQKGFHIKARGNIDVLGSALGENVLTSQRSISIKGFHQGFERSSVSAQEDYSVGIAHGVSADVGGNIIIGKEARDCLFRAGLGVLAPHASFVGGSAWCVKGFEVKTLGNDAGVTTAIELRNELEVTKEYRVLSDNIRKHETAVAALELHIGPYLKNRQRVPLLKNPFRAKMSALIAKYDSVAQSLEKLREQERTMRESRPVQDDARVNVIGEAFPGVQLSAGDTHYTLVDRVAGPVTYRKPAQQGEWMMDKFQAMRKE
jgi:uncharacterized protein (DUF342 family)